MDGDDEAPAPAAVAGDKNKTPITAANLADPESYHPMLPSINGAAADYTRVTSDHVPILATIPVTDASGKVIDEIRVLSWNVLMADSANGFAPLGRGYYGETKEQKIARYKSIAEGLKRMVEQQKPHFITLQEISRLAKDQNEQNQLLYWIQQSLGDDWGVSLDRSGSETHDPMGVITLYDKKEFENKNKEASRTNNILDGSIDSFQRIKNPSQTVKIVNSHAGFSKLPHEHETAIQKYLGETQENETFIVAGDFNCHLFPIADEADPDAEKPQKTTTSATVSTYRAYKKQGACAIDGAFHSQRRNGKVICKQAKFKHLNPETGKVFTQEELKPLKNMPRLQQEEVDQFRMMMCVDEDFRERPYVDGKTVFAYQDELRKDMKDNSVLVRPARNLNNAPGLGISFKLEGAQRKFYERIKRQYEKNFQFEVEETMRVEYGYIYAPKAEMQLLVSLMPGYHQQHRNALAKPILDNIREQIVKRPWKVHGFFQHKIFENENDRKGKSLPTHIYQMFVEIDKAVQAEKQQQSADHLYYHRAFGKAVEAAVFARVSNKPSVFSFREKGTRTFYDNLLFQETGFNIDAEKSLQMIKDYIDGKELEEWGVSSNTALPYISTILNGIKMWEEENPHSVSAEVMLEKILLYALQQAREAKKTGTTSQELQFCANITQLLVIKEKKVSHDLGQDAVSPHTPSGPGMM